MESSCRVSHYLRFHDPRIYSRFQVSRCRRNFSKPLSTTRQKKKHLLLHNTITSSGTPLQDSVSCRSFQENERVLPCEGSSPKTGGIVALGKFEALHIGHRELAIQASKAGTPFLLSFIGMAEVFGWEQRSPIVAKCDRKRVLSSWAPYCGNVVPVEFHLEFRHVRHLSPQQFVERLSKELKVRGVVAGENYRFGYKAAGDASELVRLCKEFGLGAYIVTSVMDKHQCSSDRPSQGDNPRERGQVSSTRVRRALAEGDMKYVSELLGRKYRLVLSMNGGCVVVEKRMSAPKSCMLNQQPREGLYENCTLLIDEVLVGPCRTIIDATHIHIELSCEDAQVWAPFWDSQLIGIEFGYLGEA
ncbi:hypothetical protein AAC387_Pa01g1221 [Persea americana]